MIALCLPFADLPVTDNILLLPILKTDTLKTTLTAIAVRFDLPAHTFVNDFNADAKEMIWLYPNDAKHHVTKIALLGLGSKPTEADLIAVSRHFVFAQKSRLTPTLCIGLDYLATLEPAKAVECFAIGCQTGTYQIGLYKQKDEKYKPHPLAQAQSTLIVTHNADNEATVKTATQRGKHIGEVQVRIMDLVNASPRHKTPEFLATWAQTSGEAHGFDVKVFDKAACVATGLHALLSVSDGSQHEPRFIIMEYRAKTLSAEQLANKTIGLVGKGVTFDTGGISIKPSANMQWMKSDMGGAAAVFGAMEVAARLQLPVHLVGIVCATENMVDGAATRPGDVIQSYAGKSIEVTDTDAEGRLVLADGLAYLKKHFAPDVMIDLATLTGSAVATLGYHAAAFLTNDDTLSAQLTQAADSSGERLWRLPLWDVYADDMKSDVADVMNFSGKPMAGAISAAKFLEIFTDAHPRWAHIDMAGTVLSNSELGAQRTATAYGVRLLTRFLETAFL
jgi:leucyl aminopeptidase